MKLKIILITFLVFILFFWIIAPSPSFQLPTEYLYYLLIPKYPNAQNLKKTYNCGFTFEVNEDELREVKSFYENSFLLNALFKLSNGRSYEHHYQGDSGIIYQNFSNFYIQKLNITQRGIQIYGFRHSQGSEVQIKCTTWNYFG